jgi:DNA repair protein RadC
LLAELLSLGRDVGIQFSLRQLEQPIALAAFAPDSMAPGDGAGSQLTRAEFERLSLLSELVRRVRAPTRHATSIASAHDVLGWARLRLVHLEHEELWVLCLDAKNTLNAAERVAQGGLHGCGVTPRDVLRPAVRNAAAAIVVVHNHPSGDPTPSQDDVTMTEHLAKACAVLGIPLLDHVVVARDGARSALAAVR